MYFFIDEAFVFNLANSSEDVISGLLNGGSACLNFGLYQK